MGRSRLPQTLRALVEAQTPLRVLSLGAGVQSSTLLLMAVHGEIHIDRAIFADTQWEPRAVYDWLEYLMPLAEKAGIPVDVVSAGNIREDAANSKVSAWLPMHILVPEGVNPLTEAEEEHFADLNEAWVSAFEDGQPWPDDDPRLAEMGALLTRSINSKSSRAGILRRQCTKNYKLMPIRRRLRELLGKQGTGTVLIGISLDEAHRIRRSDVKYLTNEYPLVDRRMTRQDCLRWLVGHGYRQPPKSACVGCPFTEDRRWREMRDKRPDEWADAVAFDSLMRDRRHENGQAFLHRSLVPLPMVDLRTPQDRGQLEMFDDVSDGECGAFSCFGGGE